MRNEEVLIVGAGPTGLSMAIELKRLGVPFRLVEKSLRGAQYSQALVVQARTLEQFERYGIAETAVQRGRPLKHASMISEGRTIISFSLDKIPGHYPFVLFLPQNETEALLTKHLESLGGRIERGIELLSIKEKANGAEVQLRGADGTAEDTMASWVVGCDGAHSSVREGLKIPFSGAKVGLNFFLGDLELEGPDLLGDELRIYLHRGDVVFIAKLKEKVFRVIAALHSEQDAAQDERQLKLSDFQEPMDRAGIRLRASSALWMTPFRVSDRRAERIRQGHIFLAGDASHIHSPVAGQGMNTGIQDAANLAWKIAAVRNGADEKLLESYEEERGKVSEQLLNNTSRVLKAVTTTNVLLEKLRDAFLHTTTQIPYVQDHAVGFIGCAGRGRVLGGCATAAVISLCHRPQVDHAGTRWRPSRCALRPPCTQAPPQRGMIVPSGSSCARTRFTPHRESRWDRSPWRRRPSLAQPTRRSGMRSRTRRSRPGFTAITRFQLPSCKRCFRYC